MRQNMYLILFIWTMQALSCKNSNISSCADAVSVIIADAQKARNLSDSIALLKELEEASIERLDCMSLHYYKGSVFH